VCIKKNRNTKKKKRERERRVIKKGGIKKERWKINRKRKIETNKEIK
jgi:hypothetical protein